MSAEKTSEEAVMLVVNGSGSSEWRLQCCLARILFPVVHFLQELLRLLFVDERQSRQAFLQLKRMEKDAVLVVAPIFKDLLVPDHSSVSGLPQG